MSRKSLDKNKKNDFSPARQRSLSGRVIFLLATLTALFFTALTAYLMRAAPSSAAFIVNPLVFPARYGSSILSELLENGADFLLSRHNGGLEIFRTNDVRDSIMASEPGYYKIIMAPITYTKRPGSGNGLSLMIQTPGGRTILIDGGMQALSPDGSRIIHGPGTGELDNLKQWLEAHTNGAVDLWILTHPHNDHVRSAAAVIYDWTIPIGLLMSVDYPKKLHDEEVFDENEHQSAFYYDAVDEMIERRRYATIRAGFELEIDGVRVEFLNAYNEDLWRENDSSAVIRFQFEGSKHKLLVLGDIQDDATTRLIERYENRLDASIVQLAHHGLDALTELYDIIKPAYGLLSAGPGLADNPDVQANSRYLEEHFDSELFRAFEEWTVFKLAVND